MINNRLGFGAWDLGITKKPCIEQGFFVVVPPIPPYFVRGTAQAIRLRRCGNNNQNGDLKSVP